MFPFGPGPVSSAKEFWPNPERRRETAVAYYILTRAIIRHHGPESTLRLAVGGDRKGMVSVAIYAIAIGLSSFYRWAAVALYVAVAVMWLVPDRRIERVLGARVQKQV